MLRLCLESMYKMANYSLLFQYFVVMCCFFKFTVTQNCAQISDCQCQFKNGSVIDLTTLGYQHEARWKSQKPVRSQNYTYYFNPCYPFSEGPNEMDCQDVNVCQVSFTNEYFDCGKTVRFMSNTSNGGLYLHYESTGSSTIRKTNVALVCSSEAYEPILTVLGENGTNTNDYEMTLTTRCACADLCRESHLSAGSVLVILFLLFVSLYLILGIVHSSLTKGAHGWELIPHYEFWMEFPLLVRDGCVYVMSGFKTDTAYEQI